MLAIRILVQKARLLQAEIVAKGKVNLCFCFLKIANALIILCTIIESAKKDFTCIVYKHLLFQGTATAKEFYKRNHQWTEGLISAAKAVAMGAKFLLYVHV